MSWVGAAIEKLEKSTVIQFLRSSASGENPPGGSLRPGEPAVNAADGVLYVGKTDGSASTIPAAVGFNQIVTLTQSQYDAITATASATTLYIVTADPE
jgi:hypothetical protein